jgi:hypothetical protein
MSDTDTPTHEELAEQAEAVLEATEATMYYPVAHGEAAKLQSMIEELKDVEVGEDV